MTALTASMWIPWLAKEARIYEKNGLDVEIILLRGSGQSSQALLGGSLFAAPVALPQVMLADLNGADLVNVAHTIACGEQQIGGKTGDQKTGRSARQEGCDFQHRLAGRLFVSLRAAQVWLGTQIAKLPGCRSARTPERLQALLSGRHRRRGCRPIPPTCKPSAEVTAF